MSKNDAIDLAILEIEKHVPESFLMTGDTRRALQYLEPITLVGYPSHAPGRDISIKTGEIVSFAKRSTIRRFNVSATIVVGNSGGPVLDGQNRVIGVAVTGADREDEAERTEDHGVIPIGALEYLRADVGE